MTSTERARFFALDTEVGRCPYSVFEELRKEEALHFEDSIDAYVVSRYTDLVEVLKDPETFSSNKHAGPHLATTMQAILGSLTPEQVAELVIPFELAHLDGERHRRLRKLCSGAFTTAAARRAEPLVRATCREVAESVRARTGLEFITDYARPVAVLTLTRIIGLPDDLPTFDKWVKSLINIMNSTEGTSAIVNEYLATSREFTAYLGDRIRSLREKPDDTVLSQLVHMNQDGETFTDKELITVCLGFIAGGSDNTANLLVAAARRLAEDPELARTLRADLDNRLPAFVDEMLRLHTPVQGMFRTATRATRVGGTQIPEGAHLYLLFTSANRDEAAFAGAEELDLDRPAHPSQIGLGYGVHRCLGGPVVLVQARIAVEELLRTFDDLSMARPAEELPFYANFITPAIAELPLVTRPAAHRG